MHPPSRRLVETTWTDLEAADRPVLLVVPVGSCEQHGPHLPLGTDTLIAEALAGALVRDHPGTALSPSLTITASGEHAGFPGTLSIGNEAMEAVVVELVRSADWSRGVVLVNGHGGNHRAVERAVSRLHDEGRRVLAWWPRSAGADPHAGHTETSIMLALRPDLVADRHDVRGPVPTIAELTEQGVRTLSPSGVLGDPTGATVEHGQTITASLTADLLAAVSEWDTP